MKIKNTFICAISAMSRSKWLQPAVLILVVGIVLLGITGCNKPHH